jgi:hypothetical protein
MVVEPQIRSDHSSRNDVLLESLVLLSGSITQAELVKVKINLTKARRTGATVLSRAALVAVLLLAPALAKARVYIQIAPPAPIVETVPVAPGPTYYWVPGFWVWDGRDYVWRHGHYALPPHPYTVWVPGHWSHRSKGWYWVPGHWR